MALPRIGFKEGFGALSAQEHRVGKKKKKSLNCTMRGRPRKRNNFAVGAVDRH